MIANSAGDVLFAEGRQMNIFGPNRYVNASHEWPILEQLIGKCCPIVSCLDRPSKMRHFWMIVTCLQTTRHRNNQKTHAYQLILEKFCSLLVGFSLSCVATNFADLPLTFEKLPLVLMDFATHFHSTDWGAVKFGLSRIFGTKFTHFGKLWLASLRLTVLSTYLLIGKYYFVVPYWLSSAHSI